MCQQRDNSIANRQLAEIFIIAIEKARHTI